MQASTNSNVSIPETFDGLLSLTVCDAELKGQDLKESFEPYLKISLGSSKLTQRLKEGETLGKERYTTQSKPQSGNHPVWNESHDFSIHNMKQDSHLKIKIFDRNVLKDEFLGLSRVDLSELVRNLNNQKQYYDLIDKNNNSIGRVGIITKFVGMDLPVQQVKKDSDQAKKSVDSTDHGMHEQGAVGAVGAVGAGKKETSKDRGDQDRDVRDRDTMDRDTDRDTDRDIRDRDTRDRGTIDRDVRDRDVRDRDVRDRDVRDRDRDRDTMDRDTMDRDIRDRGIRGQDRATGRGTYDQGYGRDTYNRDTRDQGYGRDTRDQGYGRDTRDQGYSRDTRDQGYGRDTRDIRDQGYSRDTRDQGYSRDTGDQGYGRDTRDQGYGRDTHDQGYGRGTYEQGHVPEDQRQTYGQQDYHRGENKELPKRIVGQSDKAYDQDIHPHTAKTGFIEKITTPEGVKEALNPIVVEPGVIGRGKEKLSEAAAIGKEKLNQAAILAGPTYRQTMPEVLGGGYPVEPAIIKDEEGDFIKVKRAVIKDETGDIISETHQQPTMLERGKGILEEGKVKLGEAAVVGKEKLSHAATLAGPTYRQTMPEALGGGYPVQYAVIKDEFGNIISETHQQPTMLERGKEKLGQLVSGTPIAGLIGTTQTPVITEKGPVVDVSVPASQIPVLPVAQERLLEVSPETQFLDKESVQPLAQERLLEVVPSTDTTLSKVTGTVQSALGGATETAKELYREHMPEMLGGRPPTFMEKLHGHTTDTSLVGKVKALAAETLPEGLGGRAPTLTERISAQPSLIAKAKILKEETFPTVLGGKPSLTEKAKEKVVEAKEKVEEATQPSLLTLAKKAYEQNMPEALGGKPSLTEKAEEKLEVVKEKVEGALPSRPLKHLPATETAPSESLLERAKEKLGEAAAVGKEKLSEAAAVGKEKLSQAAILAGPTYRQTMPEALGGGYPVQPAIIKDEEGDFIKVKPVIINEETGEIIEDSIVDQDSLLDRAKHTLKQNLPETLGGGYPVQAAIIKDENGNIISNQPSSILEKTKQTFKQVMPETLGGNRVQAGIIKDENGNIVSGGSHPEVLLEKGKEKFTEVKEKLLPHVEGMTEKGKEKLSQATAVGKEKLNQAAILAGPTYRQTMPEALGGGYPVRPAVIKDETGDIISETHQQPTMLEKGKEMVEEGKVKLGGVAAKGKEKLDQLVTGTSPLKHLPATSGDTTQSSVAQRPTMLEKGKEVVEEGKVKLSEAAAVGKEKLEEGKIKLGEAAAVGKEKLSQATTLAGPTYRQTMPEALGGGYPVRPAVIKDESGTTISESHQTVGEKAKEKLSGVKDTLIRPQQQEHVEKTEDIPINVQPIVIVDRPLPDNYEFQGQSVPAPTHQKVTIPTPQIMISPEVQHTQQFH